ncbi:hypothetical protein ACHAWF_016907 [Thalassiosira exigua]
MATPRHRAASDVSDDEGYFSESSFSQSQSAYSRGDDDESTFSGSSGTSDCSADSIGRMLIHLEESNPSLTELTIDCKTLDKEAAIYVEQFLPTNTRVEKLCLHCGDRSSHRQVFRRLLSGVKDSKSIQCIEVRDLKTNREAAELLVPSFAHSQKLKRIRMENCEFVGSGLAMLFVAQQHNKHIRHLDFHSCRWEGHNVDIVASSLQFMSLHSLSLVDVNVPMDCWPFLFRSVEKCKAIIHLDLSKCKMDDNVVGLLAKSIKSQNMISQLSLSACDLDNKCIKSIATGLRNYNLAALDISQNREINDRGVVYLKDLIKFNKSLNQLNVEGCSLNRQSMEVIKSGLRYNNSFLKSFFSETTSQTIFGVVDSIEQIDLEEIAESTRNVMEVVSFDSEGSHRKEASPNRSRRTGAQLAALTSERVATKSAAGENTASKGAEKTKRSQGGQRHNMLL